MESKLRKAVYKGDTKKILSLLKRGTNIDELDENNRTVLLELTSYFIATNYNIPPSLIKLLIDLGANVNYQLKCNTSITNRFEFETPLVNAVKTKKIEIIKVLLENGADPNALIDNCYPPYREFPANILSLTPEDSIDQTDQEIRKLLLEFGAK
ncbi:MAG: ankyrin repeat domain-containing protein [Ignavibacteriales bacterium]|nr:ankyrin repeat domain-containing protein [Ignavibacteriales bacterium]